MGMTEKQGGSDVRANETAGPADVGRRGVHPARPQVVHLRPDERRLPRAGPGSRRAHLLPGAAGAARRASATGWTSYGSRTSWATAPTPPPSWSSTAPGRSGSATRAAAYARSSRWSPRPGSTACSGRPSLMRHALAEASWHVAHRSAFGGLLVDKPLMQNVIADLAVESEAATALAIRLAAAVDDRDDAHEAALPPDRAAARQVLGVQAHPDDGGRGAGVPGRQRLRRGVRDAAAVPRVAAELDLGGLGQRQRARRAARARPRARGAGGLAHRGRPRPGRGPAPRPRPSRAC